MEDLKYKRDIEQFSTLPRPMQPATKHDIELLKIDIKSEFAVLRLQIIAAISWAITILLLLDKIF